jgi:hypothetical protein
MFAISKGFRESLNLIGGDSVLTLKEFNFLISANVFGGLALASHVPFAYWSAVQ